MGYILIVYMVFLAVRKMKKIMDYNEKGLRSQANPAL
jgi:large-conductance mechanosensitive channel